MPPSSALSVYGVWGCVDAGHAAQWGENFNFKSYGTGDDDDDYDEDSGILILEDA